ncbi:hypothetical protein TcG_04733 [Trypanosoma cruzi]|nr:hypothetical protein TcG_04733 [Trypanosoma cruzi]
MREISRPRAQKKKPAVAEQCCVGADTVRDGRLGTVTSSSISNFLLVLRAVLKRSAGSCSTGQSEVPVRCALPRWCLLVVPEMISAMYCALSSSFSPLLFCPLCCCVMISLTECTFFDAPYAVK